MSAILREDIAEDGECELSVEGGVNLKCNKTLGSVSRRGQAQRGLRAQYSYETMLIGGERTSRNFDVIFH